MWGRSIFLDNTINNYISMKKPSLIFVEKKSHLATSTVYLFNALRFGLYTNRARMTNCSAILRGQICSLILNELSVRNPQFMEVRSL